MTISNLSPADQAFLTGVNQIEQQITTATQQITSGLKISAPADDPAEIDDLLNRAPIDSSTRRSGAT